MAVGSHNAATTSSSCCPARVEYIYIYTTLSVYNTSYAVKGKLFSMPLCARGSPVIIRVREHAQTLKAIITWRRTVAAPNAQQNHHHHHDHRTAKPIFNHADVRKRAQRAPPFAIKRLAACDRLRICVTLKVCMNYSTPKSVTHAYTHTLRACVRLGVLSFASRRINARTKKKNKSARARKN